MNSNSDVELIKLKRLPRPGTWLAAVIVLILAAMLVNGLFTNTNYHWDVVWLYVRDIHVV